MLGDKLINNRDEKLWFESPHNNQSCKDIKTNPQCFVKYYIGQIKSPRILGERKNPDLYQVTGLYVIIHM